MKNLLLLFFIFMIGHAAQSQSYVPFLGDTSYWVEQESILIDGLNYHNCTALYYTDGQTAFGNYDYYNIIKRRSCTWTNTQKPWLGGSFEVPDELVGHFREDTVSKEWFWRKVNDNVDELIFDFSVQTGDTLAPVITSNTDGGAYVHHIDTVVYPDGIARRTWVIYGINQFGNDNQLAEVREGIGSSTGWNKTMYEPFEQTFTLNCYQHDDVALYGGPCSIDVAIQEPSLSEIDVTVYPNPTQGNFSISLGSTYQSVTVTVMDVVGNRIQSNTYKQRQLLHLEIDEPAGVYLLMIECDDSRGAVLLVKE